MPEFLDPSSLAGGAQQGMPGGAQSQMPGGEQQEMSEEEMRFDIESLRKDVDKKKELVERKRSEGKGRVYEKKMEVLKQLYKIMESAGVDPSDINSVRSFLMSLEKENPDLLELFETALNAATPKEVVPPNLSNGEEMMGGGEEVMPEIAPQPGQEIPQENLPIT